MFERKGKSIGKDECQYRMVVVSSLDARCLQYHRVVSELQSARADEAEEPKQTYRVSSADEVLDTNHQARGLLGLLLALLGTRHC